MHIKTVINANTTYECKEEIENYIQTCIWAEQGKPNPNHYYINKLEGILHTIILCDIKPRL